MRISINELKDFINKYSKEHPEEDFKILEEFIDSLPDFEKLIQIEKYFEKHDLLVLKDKVKSLDPELSKLIDAHFWNLI